MVNKTGVDDYLYGFYLIKTIQVEDMDPGIFKNTGGMNKDAYIANHKFGLVGVRLDLDDATSVAFPVYKSA